MTLPNFILCGAQRSGTTSLYHYLAQHPDIFLSPKKEIHYFTKNYTHGVNWYEQHFAKGQSFRIIGEASPSYMDGNEVPERMHRLLPNAKLCFILRNPVDRAYSAYWHSVSFQQDPSQSFSEAIRSEAGYDKYVTRGFYYQHICNYMPFFERDQMHFLLTEELRAHPLAQVASCFNYLNVDAEYVPEVQQRFNVSQPATGSISVFFQRRWRRFKIRLLKSQLVSPSFRRHSSKFLASAGGYLASTTPKQDHSMRLEDRTYLGNLYHESNSLLARFLGRDLPW